MRFPATTGAPEGGRYVTSTAPSGSALADALNEQGFDLASSFAAAQEVKRLYSPPIVA